MQNIKIKLVVGNWNTVITVLSRFSIFAECHAILDKIREQLEKIGEIKPDDTLEIELDVNDFNRILVVVKALPFYDSFDIVNAILMQGNAQMADQVKAEAANDKETPKAEKSEE